MFRSRHPPRQIRRQLPLRRRACQIKESHLLKVDILVRRNSDMTHEQFVAYWRDSHAKLFSSQPIVKRTVRRYVQSRTVADYPKGVNVADYDGIAQLWFDDM